MKPIANDRKKTTDHSLPHPAIINKQPGFRKETGLLVYNNLTLSDRSLRQILENKTKFRMKILAKMKIVAPKKKNY